MAVAIPSPLSMLRAFSSNINPGHHQEGDVCPIVSPTSLVPGSYPDSSTSINSIYTSGSSSSSASSSSASSPLRSADVSPILPATGNLLSHDSPCTDKAETTSTVLSLNSLPTELRLQIFSFLDVSQLLKASMVCKKWNDLAYDGNLWGKIDLALYYTYIGAAQLQKLAKGSAGFLKYANFRGCLQLTSAVMRVFAVNCHNIEYLCLTGLLDVSGLASINSGTLDIVSSHCINLTSLNASYCRSLTVVEIGSLVRGCRKLTNLQLAHCTGLDDEALLRISILPRLKVLNVSHCPLISDHGLVHLSKGHSISEFQFLKISNCPQVSDAGLIPLIAQAKELNTLEVANCRHLTDNVVNTLAMSCPYIRHLDLEECIHITDAALHSIAMNLGAMSMEVIVLSFCDAITDDGAMALLRGCPNLEKLEVDNCSRITDQLLCAIGDGLAGGRLKVLELWDCRGVSPNAIYQLVKVKSRHHYNSSNNIGSSGSSSGSSNASSAGSIKGLDVQESKQQVLKVKSFYTRSHERRRPSPGSVLGTHTAEQSGHARRGRPSIASCNIF
ncbi:hypothetical protein SeMB42_g06200 [Synchytrium endobioticum]|uniref:F-box domain-containing protein n=1 Tax=Synchytrium endobioticum TaxID=286115 RepID=A0A507CMG4_9FUNG|nr:hypothetical protein SeMB42_g06200 [Synchytrium endobioticum]TPX43534.1 hypothetical protein SeLEV6574_g05003 [Synchytrium endobioticum]